MTDDARDLHTTQFPSVDDTEAVALPLEAAATVNPGGRKKETRKKAKKPSAAPAQPKETAEERKAREYVELVASLETNTPVRLDQKVAAILSRFPETRDSDQDLQFRYWAVYESELFARLQGDLDALYDLTSLNSLSRARATVQNTHKLFQASEPVRLRRGQLSDEERERRANEVPPGDILTIYADESGKNDPLLLVASVWFVDHRDNSRVWTRVAKWKHEKKFEGEFHFSELKGHTLQIYKDFVTFVLSIAPTISFKSITVEQRGLRSIEPALKRLFIELVRRGVAHETSTQRAALPRRLLVYKDSEQPGPDAIFLAELREAIVQFSTLEFDSKLSIQDLQVVDSKDQPTMQLADLYAASLNRVFNRTASSALNHKDDFADFMLSSIGALAGVTSEELLSGAGGSDLHVHLRL